MSSFLIESDLTEKVIGQAIRVHKALGPGFLEKFYEEALCIEFLANNVSFERQLPISLFYRKELIGKHRLDILVENKLVIELKAVKRLEDIHYATTLSYLKASKASIALLLNFNCARIEIKRFANTLLKMNAEAPKGGSAEDLIDFIREGEMEHSNKKCD